MKDNWCGMYFRTKNLLPCPFCGGEAAMVPQRFPTLELDSGLDGWTITCIVCTATKHSFSSDETLAYAEWNLRQLPDGITDYGNSLYHK